MQQKGPMQYAYADCIAVYPCAVSKRHVTQQEITYITANMDRYIIDGAHMHPIFYLKNNSSKDFQHCTADT